MSFVLLQPFAHGLVSRALFCVLGLCEGHLIHGLLILVGEDNHQRLAFTELRNLLWQPLHGRFVGYGALSGGYDDKQVVVFHLCCQRGKLIPVPHQHIFGAHAGVLVLYILVDEGQRVFASVKLYAALQVARQACQTLHPPPEAQLKLGP